jgi:hypothetical protein
MVAKKVENGVRLDLILCSLDLGILPAELSITTVLLYTRRADLLR